MANRRIAIGVAAASVLLAAGWFVVRSRPRPAEETRPPNPSESAPVAATASVRPRSASSVRAEPADSARAVDPRCPEGAYERAFARGRKLAANGALEASAKAYDQAVRARPFDAAARAERAFVRLHALADDASKEVVRSRLEPVLDELALSRALARDGALAPQIAYTEGLAYERIGDVESARQAFVRAERRGSKAATQKLRDASRCLVSRAQQGSDLKFVKTWMAVFAALSAYTSCERPTPKDEAEARAFACGGCTDNPTGWLRGACDAKRPLVVPTGYMSCTTHYGMLQDLGDGRFYAEATVGEAPPSLERDGRLWRSAQDSHVHLIVTDPFAADARYLFSEGWSDAPERDGLAPCERRDEDEAMLELAAGCGQEGVGYSRGEVRSYYDDAGHFLVSLETLADQDKAVTMTPSAAGILVSGGGCSFTALFGTLVPESSGVAKADSR